MNRNTDSTLSEVRNMCCRYWAEESPELRPIVEQMNQSPLVSRWQRISAIKTHGEISPTDVVPVIASNKSGNRSVFPMKWGFSGKSLLMNARSETAATKPMFKDAWASHRCIVPASYYFEWEHLVRNDGKVTTGDKYMLQPKGSTITWLCGLYRIENGLPVFVVLTREPSDNIRFIHNRMPLIMPDQLVNQWIRPDVKPEDLVESAVTDLVFEKVAG